MTAEHVPLDQLTGCEHGSRPNTPLRTVVRRWWARNGVHWRGWSWRADPSVRRVGRW